MAHPPLPLSHTQVSWALEHARQLIFPHESSISPSDLRAPSPPGEAGTGRGAGSPPEQHAGGHECSSSSSSSSSSSEPLGSEGGNTHATRIPPQLRTKIVERGSFMGGRYKEE